MDTGRRRKQPVSPAADKSGEKRKSPLRDFLEVVIPALLIFLVVKTFFFEARYVPSSSMIPTINLNDRFLESKVAYSLHVGRFAIWRFRTPRRGEIIVFRPPAGLGRNDDFVKRVIGVSGDTVEIREGRLYLNGRLTEEPYVPVDEVDYRSSGPYHVPAGHLFVMGDNRRESRDSRYWLYVPVGSVDGKAFWRFWPLDRISLLH